MPVVIASSIQNWPESARVRTTAETATSTTSTPEAITQFGSSERLRKRPARCSPAGRGCGGATVVNSELLRLLHALPEAVLDHGQLCAGRVVGVQQCCADDLRALGLAFDLPPL